MSSSESDSAPQYESLSEKIIVEVQKRPALYDTTLRQYSDRNEKNKLWEEIYVNVLNNWITLSEGERKKKGSIIQKKWKNMRDSFAKELAMQRGKSGPGAIKKRKYVHFDSLLFLVPSLQKRKTSSNVKSTSEDHPDIDLAEYLPPTNNNRTPSSEKASKSQSNNEDNVQKIFDYLNTMQNKCEYDEDVNFSQMIVPMLRKLNDDQKHFAKIEIMNVLQRAKSFFSFESSIHGQGSTSHVSFKQTPSPQSYYTYSPSRSPTMPIQLPVSTPVPATTSVTKEPQIIHQEITSTDKQAGAQFVTGPAKQTISVPLNTSTPSTSQAPMNSIQIIDQPELLQYVQIKEEPTAAD